MIASYFDDIVKTASELIAIPSYSCKEQELAIYIQQKMKELEYDEVITDAYGNVFGIMKGDGTGSSVCMNCHMDVVDEGDHALWKYPPFSGTIADGRIWGRGASDTKGTLAIQLYIPHILKKEGYALHGDLVVAAVCAEEIAGFGSMAHTRENRMLCDYCILGEATENDIAIGSRGRLCAVITIRGKASHASLPHIGVNPFDALPDVLKALKQLELGSDPLFGNSQLSVTKITSSEKGTNVIPNELTLYADVRQSSYADSEEQIQKKLYALMEPLNRGGIHIDVKILYFPITMYTGAFGDAFQGEPLFICDKNEPYIQYAKKVVEKAVGHEIQTKPWAFATDAGHYWAKGVKCLGYSPAEIKLCHTTQDSIDIRMMKEGATGYIALVKALSDLKKEIVYEKK